mgnify:CR=1 FL=1
MSGKSCGKLYFFHTVIHNLWVLGYPQTMKGKLSTALLETERTAVGDDGDVGLAHAEGDGIALGIGVAIRVISYGDNDSSGYFLYIEITYLGSGRRRRKGTNSREVNGSGILSE